jgi:hypothetical protein
MITYINIYRVPASFLYYGIYYPFFVDYGSNGKFCADQQEVVKFTGRMCSAVTGKTFKVLNADAFMAYWIEHRGKK